MKGRKLSEAQAIRKHCIECSGGSVKEVEECNIKNCYLYDFRMGKSKTNKQLKLEDTKR